MAAKERGAFFHFPAKAGGIFLAGHVVRLNVCVGRETLRELEGDRVANFQLFGTQHRVTSISPLQPH